MTENRAESAEGTPQCEQDGHKWNGFGYDSTGMITAAQCEICGRMVRLRRGDVDMVLYEGWPDEHVEEVLES